eukprot:110842-Pleurochrysis_carterae.AAC.2
MPQQRRLKLGCRQPFRHAGSNPCVECSRAATPKRSVLALGQSGPCILRFACIRRLSCNLNKKSSVRPSAAEHAVHDGCRWGCSRYVNQARSVQRLQTPGSHGRARRCSML